MRFLKRSFVAVAVCAGSAAAQNAVPMQSKPLDPANMDTSVSACTDFFQYANGGWIKRNPVPPAFSNWGGFSELSENNNAALLSILEAAAKNKDPHRSANVRKLGAYYASCMDSVGAERAGIAPVKPLLNRIDAAKNIAALQNTIGWLHGTGNGVLFGFGSTQVGCTGSGEQITVLVQATGAKTFKKGDAVATAEIFGCNNVTCGSETDSEVIQLQK